MRQSQSISRLLISASPSTKHLLRSFIALAALRFNSFLANVGRIRLIIPLPDPDRAVVPLVIPNLLLAGAQKSGTSALHAALELISQEARTLCFPKKLKTEEKFYAKELHFFDMENRWREGPLFFHDRFRHCLTNHSHKGKGQRQWRLDATPAYMLFPERIVSFYQDHGVIDALRIIFCLREPVSREISWYKHKKRDFIERGIPLMEGNLTSLLDFWTKKNFSDLLAQNGNNARNLASPSSHNKGLYGPLLRRWIASMPGRRSQILVLSYDELLKDQVSVLRRINGFLGLIHQGYDASRDLVRKVPIRNKFSALLYNSTETPCSYQDDLAMLYEKSNEQLYQLLRQNPGPPTEERPFRIFQYKCDH